jgi:hypothetical protein
MTNQELQNQLELFKSQMKEVSKSLCGFESQLEQEKVKIEKLRYSFAVLVKLINRELISSLKNLEELFEIKGSKNKP